MTVCLVRMPLTFGFSTNRSTCPVSSVTTTPYFDGSSTCGGFQADLQECHPHRPAGLQLSSLHSIGCHHCWKIQGAHLGHKNGALSLLRLVEL